MFKIIFFIVKVIIVAIIIIVGYFFFQTKVAGANSVDFNFFTINQDAGGYYVQVKDEEKPFLKKIAQKINGIIYKEATIHNPEGDMLPDAIDDLVKNKIKEKIQ